MRLILPLLLALTVSACGTLDVLKKSVADATGLFNDGEDPRKPNELEPLKTSLDKHVIWEEDTGVGNDGQRVNLQPLIIDDRSIVVADREGLVQFSSLDSGKLIWEKELDLPVSAAVGADDLYLFVGSSDGYIVALSQEDGSVVWKVSVPSEVLAIPQAEDDVLVVRSIDGQVIGLDVETGTQRWNYKQPVPAIEFTRNQYTRYFSRCSNLRFCARAFGCLTCGRWNSTLGNHGCSAAWSFRAVTSGRS